MYRLVVSSQINQCPETRFPRAWNHGSERQSLEIDEIDMSNSTIQASKSQKRDFRDFLAQVCYLNRNVKIKNFMHMEWSEEKFLKIIVGYKTRIRL
jgi:hypothetical protein